MTREELNKLSFFVDGLDFTPEYTTIPIKENSEDGTIITDFDYIIIKTAEESYIEWLYNKDNPQLPQPDKISNLLNKLETTKSELVDTNLYITDLELQNFTLEERISSLESLLNR